MLGDVYNRLSACCLAGPWLACVVVGLLLEFWDLAGGGHNGMEMRGRGRAEKEVVYAGVGVGGLKCRWLSVVAKRGRRRCGLVVQRLASTN
jgi:hypothetical protein